MGGARGAGSDGNHRRLGKTGMEHMSAADADTVREARELIREALTLNEIARITASCGLALIVLSLVLSVIGRAGAHVPFMMAISAYLTTFVTRIMCKRKYRQSQRLIEKWRTR